MKNSIEGLADETISLIQQTRHIDDFWKKQSARNCLLQLIKEVSLIADKYDTTTRGMARIKSIRKENKCNGFVAEILLATGKAESAVSTQAIELLVSPSLDSALSSLCCEASEIKNPFGESVVFVSISNLHHITDNSQPYKGVLTGLEFF